MSKLDTALTTFILLVYIGAFTPSQAQQGVGAGADPAGKIGEALTILATPLIFFLIYKNRERFLDTLRRATWPLYMVALTVLSTFWSINSGVTLRRSALFAISAAYAVHLASFGPELRDRLLGRAVLVTIVFSYLLVIFLPSYGVSGGNHFGEWRGVFDHKNILGKQMVFSFFLVLYSDAFKSRATARVIAVFALILLGMSQSGTAIAAFAFVLLFAGLLSIRSFFARRQSVALFWLIVVPVFLVAAGIAFGFRNEILEAFGKNETLTGRTTIWAIAAKGISQKPWLGWGYESFFTQAELLSSFGAIGPANHAHNGFLDILLATGFIGFAVFLIGYFVAFRNAWRLYRDNSERSAQWPMLFLIMLVLLNLPESVLLRKGTFLWIPYVSLALWGMQSAHTSYSHRTEDAGQALPAQSVSA
jgi:O-antigen ligase